MTYQQAAGFNNAAGLANISIQPAGGSGVLIAEERYAGGGDVYEQGGRYYILTYTALTGAEYNALLTEFGLDNARFSRRTWRLLADEDRQTFANFNGIVKRPNPGEDGSWDDFFWRNVRFYINRLVDI